MRKLLSKPNVSSYSIPKVTRPADITEVYCYRFTTREIEEFEADCKAATLPKVVRPEDITDVHCYSFTSFEIEVQPDLAEGVNASTVVRPCH